MLNSALEIIGGLGALIFGGHLLVLGASRIAGALGVSPVVIGLTVVAFGTSSPELAVSLFAAFKGSADLAVANVVGSNIFNTFFILGVSGLIAPLIIHSQIIRREVPIMIGASFVLLLFLLNLHLGRGEGLILFSAIIAYTVWLVRSALKERAQDHEIEVESEREFGELAKNKHSLGLSSFWVLLGLGSVMLGAEWLVDGAVAVARALGVSEAVIGLTIVAAGTSLPEVVASVIATMKGERDIAVGNVIGSNIYNILAIPGLSSLVAPEGIAVSAQILRFDLPVMILSALLCLPFFYSQRTLSRWEGASFLALYVGYTGLLIHWALEKA